ncbi:MAG: type II toxin-antitoxin system death-on-curing family toxin [Bacteroidetes bacterium]|nr:type II toxin-antitoxin system death-on-curing family toxin [Bacteroidota bacterium]
MILLDDMLTLHDFSITHYGGAKGIRDQESLSSAIARPFQTFDSIELYSNVFEKAASLAESQIVNHPFTDGNKRTGFLAMTAFLRENGYTLTASNEGAYEFIIGISTGKIKYEEVVKWLTANTTLLQ